MTANSLWITWEKQTRNAAMANAIGATYIELISKKPRLIRYIVLSALTAKTLLKEKPQVVFYQNPSVILGLLCVTLKKLILQKVILVGDYHNAAIDGGRLQFLHNFIARHSDLILVTNKDAAKAISNNRIQTLCFPDPLPFIPASPKPKAAPPPRTFILFIASWSEDEPIENVFQAYLSISERHEGIPLLVTGKVKEGLLEKPIKHYERAGIVPLGFVSRQDYNWFVTNALFTIDLTLRSNCMVCGAYESISVYTPALLSNNLATVEYFKELGVYTDNSVEDIRVKMEHLAKHHESKRADIAHAIPRLTSDEAIKVKELKSRLNIS